MPRLTKWLFLEVLARILCMPQPTQEEQDQEIEDQIDWSLAHSDLSNYSNPYKKKFRQRRSIIQETMCSYENTESLASNLPGYKVSPSFIGFDSLGMDSFCEACAQRKMQKYPPNVNKALEGVSYIANHHKEADKTRQVRRHFQMFSRNRYFSMFMQRDFVVISM